MFQWIRSLDETCRFSGNNLVKVKLHEVNIFIKPPVVKDLPNQSKKKKKKEPITRRDAKSVTDVNKSTKEDTGMFQSTA